MVSSGFVWGLFRVGLCCVRGCLGIQHVHTNSYNYVII